MENLLTDAHAPLRVNGIEISASDIDAAVAELADAPGPGEAPAADVAQTARYALAIRELVRQRAVELGVPIDTDRPDTMADAVFAKEVVTPVATPEESRRYYEQHRERFTSGELVHASHILFGVTGRAPLALVRAKAEETLNAILQAPDQFESLARERSNCPSAQVGGSLGQLDRDSCVPEFAQGIFGSQETGVLPRLIKTRFGFHLVRIDHRVPGTLIPFDAVKDDVATMLTEQVRLRATRQYVLLLAAQAELEGVSFAPADGPLVQ
ncbi:peptidylprolyl isomerase [Pandoraea commovens]|uniref:peptidylprolyl isomerase n=1 Tax=Pandoraea commovens TaxID=2508289 RepID=A0A5E4RR46_9BURK|nr:peptidylprolyl isomerase [Pandoraea commovens]UVA77263.1 peptidylprolyl isomerase [Pandoraea commovens]VVD65485.1 Peptidyl-prolyl cis-trans isomerase D [Pandoraea commovens]